MIKKKIYKHGVVYNCDIMELIESEELVKGSFYHILTDPPYGYLKHKIEKNFNRELCWKLISDKHKNGYFVLFGRGDVFYRDNLILSDLGYKHKEDCAYIKNVPSSPILPIQRHGEYYSIRLKGKGTFNKVFIPLSDEDNIADKQIIDWFRRSSDNASKEAIFNYIQNQTLKLQPKKSRENVAVQSSVMVSIDRGVHSFLTLSNGMRLRNVLYASRELLKEGSHPTIKSSKALEYLIKLISHENETIFDPFIGSGSAAVACLRNNRRFIGCEIDEEYFHLTCSRIENEYRDNMFL